MSTNIFRTSFDPSFIRKGCYIDSRFETDMKLLLGKIDRMEALMEKLIETVYILQLKPSVEVSSGDDQVLHQVPPEATPQEEEHLDEDTLDPDHNYTTEQIEIEEEIAIVEEQVEDTMDSHMILKEEQGELQLESVLIPREVSQINGIALPISSVEELLNVDQVLTEQPDFANELRDYLEHLIVKEKTIKEVVKHIISENVLYEYAENLREFKSLYLIKTILRESFVKHKDPKNYSKRIKTLFSFELNRTNNESIYEIDDIRLPVRSTRDLAEIDKKINSNQQSETAITQVINEMFLSADRNITNFLAKILRKEVIEDCSWAKAGGKRSQKLSDYTLFNRIVPKIIGIRSGSKQLDDIMRLSLHQLRRRGYAVDFRRRNKAKKQIGQGGNEYGEEY